MSNFLETRVVETPAQAFLIGRSDRTSGRPITCIKALVDGVIYDADNFDFWDGEAAREIDDAYYVGYDPNNDLRLVLPEFVEMMEAKARQLCDATGLPFPAPNEPVSACEREQC